MIVYLIAALVFGAFFLTIFVIFHFIARRRDPVRRRLKDLKEGEKGKGVKIKNKYSSHKVFNAVY